MEQGENCPICYSEYTNLGEHRTVSLKCGHLFGLHCIETWFGRKKTSLCPTCSKPNRKTDIRIIFASKVIAYDVEKEQSLIKDLYEEKRLKNELLLEKEQLATTIQLLNSEIKKMEKKYEQFEDSVYIKRKFIKRINLNIKSSILLYDKINHLLILTFKNSHSVGILKYNLENIMVNEFVPLFEIKDLCSFFIKDVRMSPYNDGFIACVYEKHLKIVNCYNNNELVTYEWKDALWSVCFDEEDRNIIYAGDSKGMLITYDLRNAETQKNYIFIGKGPIHSLYKYKNRIYCGTIKGLTILVLENEILQKVSEIEKEQLICTNLTGHKNIQLLTFRNKNMEVIHFIHKDGYDSENEAFNKGLIQMKRIRDKIENDTFALVDEKHYKLLIYSCDGRLIDSFTFKEPIVDFCFCKDKLFVLTEKFLNIFSC